jgi:hypothetical protein
LSLVEVLVVALEALLLVVVEQVVCFKRLGL